MPTPALRPPPAVLQAYERYGRLLPRIAEVVFVILLAHACAILMWRLVPTPASAAWRAPPPPPPDLSMGGSQGPNVEQIANAHLFGHYEPPAVAADQDLTNIAETQLDLTLMGILAATAERGSRALIGSSNGEEKPYAIGDDVTRGVTLQSIYPDRVILSRNGNLETLRLDKNAVGSLPAGIQNFRRPQPRAQDSGDGDGEEDTSSMLSEIREEVINDPTRASEYIRVQPASNGGQLRGYRIYPGRDRSVFTAVGLRPGDLVTQVNGIQLNDANTALQMLQQLSSANNLTVVVERGGQQQTVNVNLD